MLTSTATLAISSETPLSVTVGEERLMLCGDLISSQVEGHLPAIAVTVKEIDLSGINAFDSAGVAWLVTYFAGGERKFVNYPAALSQLADLYGLTVFFPASSIITEKRDC